MSEVANSLMLKTGGTQATLNALAAAWRVSDVLFLTRIGVPVLLSGGSARMHTEPIPSFDEFRACVLAAYAPLMRSMGFVELPWRQGKGVTCFTVRLRNATTIIEVEGIHYGTAAWTKVFRASDREETRAGLPIYKLLQLRQGLTAKQQRRRNRQGQLAEVEETAAAIIKHAGDVLLGDFSELERLAETERLLQRKRLEKALPREEKAAAVAASEAGHAFKRGDYAKVVELLEPHLAHLSPSQRRRYAVAKAKI